MMTEPKTSEERAAQRWYKVLVNGNSCHGGDFVWPLPTANPDGSFTPGSWVEVGKKADLGLCRYGLHLTTDPTQWLKVGCEAYLAEGRQAGERNADKQVFGKARLLAPAPEAIPDWWRRVSEFILIDLPKWTAARDTAWAAARDPAWAAAWDAARDAARAAARAAARDAAWDTAWAAAWDTAWAAAWDSAWAAAWDATWDATLYCCVEALCADLSIDERHRQFTRSLRDHYVREANNVAEGAA